MALKEITTLLNALNDGIEAKSVGLFDARQGRLYSASTVRTSAFWDAFSGIDCLDVDWGAWDRQLLNEGRALVGCGCGRHSVESFLIHDRWVLLVLAVAPLFPAAEAIIASAVKLLEQMLPPGRGRAGSARPGDEAGDDGSNAAELGFPAWWSRRRSLA